MHVVVKNVCKTFGQFKASDQISFNIEKGRLVGLLGPSGGGKTTILRMLAGLEHPDSGEIYFHGKNIVHKRPQERGIGFVFQNYALFKHMSVYDNIAFGLTVQKKKKAFIRNKVMELVELTGLEGLERRLPHELSGGQRQRVAFARALAPEPQLLLLDEPFAAIDAKVRKELRTWLKETISRIGITSIFVTHDQEEAVEVADDIIIINKGRLEQMGTPAHIYQQPQTPFVASFIGESNVLDDIAHLKGFDVGVRHLQAFIRPEFIDIQHASEVVMPYAAERAVVRAVYYRGVNWLIEVEIGPYTLFGYRSLELKQLQPGDEVSVLIHRLYQFNNTASCVIENSLKSDPMPIHI